MTLVILIALLCLAIALKIAVGCCAPLCRFCLQPFPHVAMPLHCCALLGRTQHGHQLGRRSTDQVGWSHAWVSSEHFSHHPQPKWTFTWQNSLCQELLNRTVLVKLASPISVMPKRHHKGLVQRAECCAPAQLHLRAPAQLHAGAVEMRKLTCE